jgi:hypothetical protein
MVIKLKGLSSLINKYQEAFTHLLSKILNLVELTAFEYFGELVSYGDENIILIWDETRYNKSDSIRKRDISNYIFISRQI